MSRLAGFVAATALFGSACFAQTPPAPAASAVPPDLASHSPTEILTQGAKNLNDLIAVLDTRPSNVVVTVDGIPVTDGEVADELRGYPPSIGYVPMTAIYKLAIENVMRQRALAIKAKQAGVDKDPVVQRRVGTATDRVLIAEYMRREITPKLTDQALRARYDAQVAGKSGALEAHIRVIMLPTRDAALEAGTRLKMNQDFAALAKEVSKDASAAAGGDLGWVPLDAVDPPIGAVAFAMNPGDVSANPVRTNAGWFLIRNEGVRQQAAPTFEAARERLRREMAAEQMAAMRAEIAAKVNAEPGKIPSIELDKKK